MKRFKRYLERKELQLNLDKYILYKSKAIVSREETGEQKRENGNEEKKI